MKKLTLEQFIKKARKIHGWKYDYSKVMYLGYNIKVVIICPMHGEFEQTPHNHLSEQGCSICGNISISNKLRLKQNKFIKKARRVHGCKYDYSKVNYINNLTKIIIICSMHGEFEQTPGNHLQGQGCIKCRDIKLSLDKRITQEEFIRRAILIHDERYDYSRVIYINNWTKIIIICKDHGEFEQTPNDHLGKHGCPKCNYSKGEKALELIFNKHNIEAKPQFKLPHHTFEYDFYLPEYKVFIEFHGIQHYEPVDYFGGIKKFKYTLDCDAKKISLAREYRIPIIEIHYKNLELPKEQFEELILKLLKQKEL